MKIEMGNAMKIWIGNKENLQYVSKIIADDWRSIYLELYSHNMVKGNVEIDDLTEEEVKKIICEETADKYDAVLIENVQEVEKQTSESEYNVKENVK